MAIDVTSNRDARKWTGREQAGRVLWALTGPLFRFSPRPLWGWRRILLRLFGAQVGKAVHVYPTVRITIPWNVRLGEHCSVGDRAIIYALGPITVGERATVSQGAHLCAGTHDWRNPEMPLVKPPIKIGNDTWVAADAFIGPGITIGDGAIVGARAVVMRDVAALDIVGGNPAKIISRREI